MLCRIPRIRAPWTALLLLCAAMTAHGETQLFRTTINGIRYAPEAAVYTAGELPYVSLFDIAGQIGGSGKILSDTEAEIQAAGGRAVVTFNAAEVMVGLSSFTLEHPILRYEDQALVARDEAAKFFDDAFAVSLLALREGDSVEPETEAAPEPDPMAENPAVMPGVTSVIIDAGHGGGDAGSVGPGGTAEKDVALAIALRLRDVLGETPGLTVHLSREEDRELTLLERVSLIKQYPDASIISIHTGASLSEAAHGVELFTVGSGDTAASASKGLAERLSAAISKRVDAPSRGVRTAPLRLFREAAMPGVLIEVGCLTNSSEEELLKTDSYQRLLARGIADGLQGAAGGDS
ncbi:MAG: hypothetical protein GC168_02650 [Candidatus Hydrogenedens sp.]|nr:hypothetical protein [Candidatus Hydrogenedens sp.]